MACRREGVVLGWAGWHADGGERGVAGGGGTARANGGAFPAADSRPIATSSLGATDCGFWSTSRKVRRSTGRWWWLRIGRRGWDGSAVIA
jgi:hypothetical protein